MLKVCQRRIVTAKPAKYKPPEDARLRRARIQDDGALKVLQGIMVTTKLAMRQPPEEARPRRARIQDDGALKVLQGLDRASQVPPDGGTPDVRLGIIGIQIYGVGEREDGLFAIGF